MDSCHTIKESVLGTIGHVAHGKSTVVKAISGVHTVRFKNELVRNITIKLGYANAKVRTCGRCLYCALKDSVRSTSVRTMHVRGRAATALTSRIKRIARHASDQVAVTA